MVTENTSSPIDCACVIHGTAYSWDYVDRLYSMLTRHLTRPVRLHVYTEADRIVPEPYVKHTLTDWGISGPRQSWWYKMQLFNTEQFRGPLLYFDLDVVIVENIDWIVELPIAYFWTVRDFKHLWKPENYTINSSIMWFNTAQFEYVWLDFIKTGLTEIIKNYRGDQDYISAILSAGKRRFFDQERIKSWRWQCLDGGYNFEKKQHLTPNTGTSITHPTSVLIFHGKPKPDQIQDPVVVHHWQ